MADLHTVETVVGSNSAFPDRLLVMVQSGVANAAAAAAGDNVTVAITSENLPANYVPVVNPNQAAAWFISAKTANGFTVNLVPLASTVTLAAGTIDVAVFG